MPDRYTLVITTNPAAHTADLRLLDTHGRQIGYHQADFSRISASHQHGLFDLRTYLRLYVEAGQESAAIGEIGICIAEEVLGEEIFTQLWQRQDPRSLDIQLPAFQEGDHLAAALSRVPWEIARPRPDQPSLSERNLRVRVTLAEPPGASACLSLDEKDEVRILFVFAEARGSRPLGARKERRELLGLFQRKIYPQRRVVAHFLTHGVTRERLEDQIRQHGGYHVVHWSGHGHMNLLELCKPDGSPDHLSGEGLLQLFVDAGGYLPRLCFLSACHSGDIQQVRNWQDFGAVASGDPLSTRDVVEKDAAPDLKALDLKVQPGYTGTAQALLHGGVRSVVAMRYAVGDDYAREMAVEFYEALFAHAQPKPVNTALAMAEAAMLESGKHEQTRFSVCDHATPVLYGEEDPGLVPPRGRSSAANPNDPRLHRIEELTAASHEHFVGRTWQLAELGAGFIGASEGGEVRPVAVITGLGGLGKTALTAEALELWQERFDWVLLYQTKPHALPLEFVLSDIHLKLIADSPRYQEHLRQRPGDAVYREATKDFTGPQRIERLVRKLVRALNDERILLVLDNFETQLKPQAEPAVNGGSAAWACQDPAWDQCLAALAEGLAGGPSRVLITCRRPLAALPAEHTLLVRLGPLSASEAALFLREHPVLGGMFFGTDKDEQEMAIRLLKASRFHPLLMDRLVRLAAQAVLRPQLLQALSTLESATDFSSLPGLFSTDPNNAREIAYLDDALAASIDQLIEHATPEARRLLWIISLADEPVSVQLVEGAWSGETREAQFIRVIKQVLANPSEFSDQAREVVAMLSPEQLEHIEKSPLSAFAPGETLPLLVGLVEVGLVTGQLHDSTDLPLFSCHELVRERILKWMETHPQNQGSSTQNSIQGAYADHLLAEYEQWRLDDPRRAIDAGTRGLLYCIQSHDYSKIANFAGNLVIASRDPQHLAMVRSRLEPILELVPEGRDRWRLLEALGDAWRLENRPDQSLPYYEAAAKAALADAETGGEDDPGLWRDYSTIADGWSYSLARLGRGQEALDLNSSSVAAKVKEGGAAVRILGTKLEGLRLKLDFQGDDDEILSEVESHLLQLQEWWRKWRSGEPLDPLVVDSGGNLSRAYLAGLEIAGNVHLIRGKWEDALLKLEEALRIKIELKHPEDQIASARISRASVMVRIPNRLAEARNELEASLEFAKNNPVLRAEIFEILSSVLYELEDYSGAIAQARRALAIRNQFPDLGVRAFAASKLATRIEAASNHAGTTESSRLRLTALIYAWASGDAYHRTKTGEALLLYFSICKKLGLSPIVARIDEILNDPAFDAFKEWIVQSETDAIELQVGIDEIIEAMRERVSSMPADPQPDPLPHHPMTTSISSPSPETTPLAVLLERLAEAVEKGERKLAIGISEEIRLCLATDEEGDRPAIEARVRGLLDLLGPPGGKPEVRLDLDLSGWDLGEGNVLESLPQPDLNWHGTFNLERGLGQEEDGVVFPVWYGTNRASNVDGTGFTGERGDRVSYGCARVWIPKSHRFGETGNPWWKRLLRLQLADDRLRLQGIDEHTHDAFYDELRRAVEESHDPSGPKTALLFLHGFNVTFEDAAIRAAQLGCDLAVPGATAFFSWPSRGSVPAYVADGTTIQTCESEITDFLLDFVANCGAEKVHLIAHSMGNRGLLGSLERITGNAAKYGKVKFGQIFLAAPDVDRDLFLKLARVYPECSDRTTLYASHGDNAVAISKELNMAPRAGYFTPYTVAPGVDTVAVPDFNLDLLGHSYFAQAEALLYDIGGLLRQDSPPQKRQRIVATQEDGVSFWQMNL